MHTKIFFKYLGIVTLGLSLGLFALHSLAVPAQSHASFALVSVGLFAAVCVGLYYAGLSALRSSSKFAFTNLVTVSVFGKMVVSLTALFLYQKLAVPENQWFVGIFLLCYVVFTVFEVWFMSKLAKS